MTIKVQQIRLPSGLRLEVAEQGAPDGLPVLLLHGFTDSWRSFEPVLPQLPPQWRVVAPSQRGHGGSDKPRGGYRTRDFAADAAALIDALGMTAAVVVGHSMGAANAMRLAIDRPERVRALVGVGSFARFSDKPDLVEFFANVLAPLDDPLPRSMVDEFQRSTLARQVPAVLLQTMIEESLRVPAHVWREASARLLDDDFSDELGRITAPTLLLRGGDDSMVPQRDTDVLLRALPNAHQLTWRGFGHAPHWEAPQRFAEALVHFVHMVDVLPHARASPAAAACTHHLFPDPSPHGEPK